MPANGDSQTQSRDDRRESLDQTVALPADVFGEESPAQLGQTPGRIVEPPLPGPYRITEAGWDTAAGLFAFAGETERAAWAVG